MKLKKHYIKTILTGMLFGSSLFAMDVATYYDVDIKSMQISIDGSKKVLALLKSGAPLQEQYTVDDEMQRKLEKLYSSVNSTPSKQAGFYTKHTKVVQDFYENNSTLQEEYTQLKETLETINKQIQTVREAQK